MATEPTAAALIVATAIERTRSAPSYATLADYWALTKPEVNFLIIVTTCAAFYLGYPDRPHPFALALLINTLLGTLLVASGAGTLNQFIERRFDAQMRRTARRPLPSGRIKAPAALWFGTGLSLAGSVYLAFTVNALAGFLAVSTLASYLFVYTPLKRRTALCTLVGALPGATPPLIGWAAASGTLTMEAWVLYALLFTWQLPHFMAIAWMYREDYERGGYMVLPGIDQTGLDQGGSVMAWQSVLPAAVLVALSIVPMLRRHSSLIYPLGGLALGSGLFYFAAALAIRRSNTAARRLLAASIIYLPLVFALMMLDKLLTSGGY